MDPYIKFYIHEDTYKRLIQYGLSAFSGPNSSNAYLVEYWIWKLFFIACVNRQDITSFLKNEQKCSAFRLFMSFYSESSPNEARDFLDFFDSIGGA